MAIEFKDGKYVDPKTGHVTLDPTIYKDWQIAEEAEKNLPSVDYFREKLGLLPEEIIPYGKTPKIDFIKVMKRLKDKPDGKFIEVTAITPTPFGEGKSTVSLGLIEGLGKLGLNVGGALRQPSGGPTMNVKGTAAGGGNALLMPMTEFSLGLTGDINDIMNAHNLAMVALNARMQHERNNDQHVQPQRHAPGCFFLPSGHVVTPNFFFLILSHPCVRVQTKKNPLGRVPKGKFFFREPNQSSSMTAISAASPRRGPIRVTRV